MKKPILKWKTRNWVIIALALSHRYLWPLLIVFCSLVDRWQESIPVDGYSCDFICGAYFYWI